MGTGANATGVQTHHLLGNVQDATKHAKEARDKSNVAASDLCALLCERRGDIAGQKRYLLKALRKIQQSAVVLRMTKWL